MDDKIDVLSSITIAQLAESQGVCTKTARNWCLREGLVSYKVGNVRRIRKESLTAWIKEREKGANI